MLDSRFLRLMQVAGAGYLGRFGAGLVIIFTIPLARKILAPELFGVWMMLSSLIGFMSFIDFGIGNGVLNAITQAQALKNRTMFWRVIVSGYLLMVSIGLIVLGGWLLWLGLSHDPLSVVGGISLRNREQALDALNLFIFLFVINIPAGLIQKIQLGVQEGYWNGFAQLASAVTTLGVFLLPTELVGRLPAIVLSTFGVVVCFNLINSVIWMSRNAPWAICEPKWAVDRHVMRQLMSSGKFFFFLQVSAAFAFQSDAIVLTQVIGADAYGDFSVVQKLFMFVSMLTGVALLGLWPAFGDALARRDFPWVIKTLRYAMSTFAVLSVSVVVLLIFAIPWIMKIWLKETSTPPHGLIVALGIWTVIEAVSNAPASLMNSANILRPQLVIALIMAITAFVMKWVMVGWLGSSGVVWATIITYCSISFPAQYFILKKFFRSNSKKGF